MKIALAQLEILPIQPHKNTEKILSYIRKAKSSNVDLIVFPQMCISGYVIGDSFLESSFIKECEQCGQKIIESSEDIFIIFGNIGIDYNKKNNDGSIRKYNALFTAYNKKLIQSDNMPYNFTIKTIMPCYSNATDERHFYSHKELAMDNNSQLNDYLKPIEINIKNESIKIAPIIYQDGSDEEDNLSTMDIINKNNDVDLFVNIACSPYSIPKNKKRHLFFSKKSKASKTPIIFVNHIGVQNSGKCLYAFDGNSCAYNNDGRIIANAGLYEERLEYLNIDFKNKTFDAPLNIDEEKSIALIFKSITFAIKKFSESLNIRRVIIGVSGGIDSAVAAAVYTYVFGSENVLLVNMPSTYNSKTTKNLAKILGINLGCHYMILPIQASVDNTIQQIETTSMINIDSGEETFLKISSFASENIQARDRSSRILAALASSFGGVFTCNANKTETTVGYATLYGDASGFLLSLADLWKHQIYDLAKYINEEAFDREIIPEDSISIIPSAELSSNQNVDEGKGDPIKYQYHDYLFRAFVECFEKITVEEILQWYIDGSLEKNIGCEQGLVKQYFKSDKGFIDDLEYWWGLFKGMSVAKRVQSPPMLVLSDSPLASCRESQTQIYYSQKYLALKKSLLK